VSLLRILLVEDSVLLSDRISEVVHSLPGVQLAASVSSEAEAVDYLERGNIDVVILDLQLKKGTGFGVLRALRKILKRPAVVVFTNFALPTYRETALELGAEHFLDKSRDYERLPEVLNEISARHH
jgi:two-component system, OmpR family, response regulator